MAHLINKV